MCDEVGEQDVDSLPLPKNWHSSVRNAVLNAIGIVRIAMLAGREALITDGGAEYARIHRLVSEIAGLARNYASTERGCSASPRIDAPNTQPLNEWPSYSCGRCVAGTERKRLAVSSSPTTPSEHGFDVPTMTRCFRPERP